MKFTIRLSYNGNSFCGWQLQKNGTSIQGELQKALSMLLKCDIPVTGAGRTDAGVNAVNYVAHFDVPETSEARPEFLKYKLNAILPKGIAVHEIIPVAEAFHARFSAVSREYHYFIHKKKDPFMENFSHLCIYPLDMDKMNGAASLLLGEHDFRCFEKTGGNNATSICTVYEASWSAYSPVHVSMMGYQAGPEDYIVFRIRANRFLRNMVRAIVGSLIDVGRGKRDIEWFRRLIETGTRSDAGESVPGKALFLSEVAYPDKISENSESKI